MTPFELVLSKFPDAKKAGNGWLVRCPAHDDNRASLSISQGEDGKALIHCHANCKTDAVCAALGLKLSDLMPGIANGKPHTNGRAKTDQKIVNKYEYKDEGGKLLFQVVRFGPIKDFRQRRLNGRGGWDWSVKGVRKVPYRLNKLVKAAPGELAIIAEGEKDVLGVENKLGLLATCNACGAGNWTPEHAQHLKDFNVVILPDNDDKGRNHGLQVARSLVGIAASIKIVELPGLPPKGDVSDWIAAGGTKEELLRLIEAAPDWTPIASPESELEPAATPAEPGAWPEIVPFEDVGLPAFPTHALPESLRQFVEALSHATQTPPDLAALLAIAVSAAAIHRRVVVEPRPGWHEPTNLYVAVLLDPGNRKSAVFSEATKPLKDLEEELIERARPAFARQLSARRQKEGRLKKLEKQAAEKGDRKTFDEATTLAVELEEEPEPVLPRLIVDDATSEKLGMILADQGGRIASTSPEGGVFDHMKGLYSKNGVLNFNLYLMGHSGDDLITDRVSRKSVRVERPAITCAYAMQPAVIEGLAEETSFRGRGLLARFLYAAPQSWIGRREIAPTPVPAAIREAYDKGIRDLASGNSGNIGSASEQIILRFDADASLSLKAWEAEIEGMLGDGGQMEVMRDWGAKLAGATVRLAGILHCLECGLSGEISDATIMAAIEIARFLVPHAEAVLSLMQATEDHANDDAKYLLKWIDRHSLAQFTKSQAQHHGKRRFPKAEDIDAALNELVNHGYIRQLPNDKPATPGRPASPGYEVNPAHLEEIQKPGKRSQYSRNSTEGPQSVFAKPESAPVIPTIAANRVQVAI